MRAKPPKKAVFYMLLFTGIIMLIVLLMQPLQIYKFQEYIAVLFPKGLIGVEQRDLLLIIQGLMLLIIIPVYILTFVFSWRYRAQNKKAKYDPDLVDNTLAEYIWWGLPLIMTLLIGAITWIKTHELDPYKPIVSSKKEIKIQVVALQWKWLFIYPEEKIATINFLQIPQETPIHFEITADSPMNSFWIPELGGQIYAMPKMKTELYLIADEKGDFRGSSANLSGEGFSGMHFVTRSSSEVEYQHWIEEAKQSSLVLNAEEYKKLAVPSKNDPVKKFQLQDQNLFNQILMKYMHPKIGK
jgi:cytochrome o ubiquinol oxidase subunit II